MKELFEKTPDCYAKEFTEWCIAEVYKRFDGDYYGICDSDLVFSTLDDLYAYWVSNINNK